MTRLPDAEDWPRSTPSRVEVIPRQ
ncbi:hypothetical protein RCHOTPOCKET_2 [Rhodobacter phage RcHotPocket]|nr:hypothetical protein RCHOTPOCKET_2 [Rhodobacter phage RcHotPocket]